MADNDEGSDIASEATGLLLKFLESKWKFGKGHLRSNEYNWTHSENMAYALESLGLFSPEVLLMDDWIPLLKDIEMGMVKALGEKTFTNKDWRRICSSYLNDIRKSIKRAE